jgi:hypothetical protein
MRLRAPARGTEVQSLLTRSTRDLATLSTSLSEALGVPEGGVENEKMSGQYRGATDSTYPPCTR